MRAGEGGALNVGIPSSARRRRLGARTKLAYASGSIEESMVTAAGVATMIYYNQVLGVSPALCGAAFLIASIVDAFADPLAGSLSDGVRTRWGRRHPFMLLAAAPLAICFYLLYQPPRGLGEHGLFLWFVLTMVGVRIAKTVYATPHSALGAELTDDYAERTSIFGWNWAVGAVSGVLLSVFVLFVIFPSTPNFANGLLDRDRYRILAIVGAAVCFSVVMFCTLATADQIPFIHQRETMTARGRYSAAARETWRNVRSLARNRSYLSVCLCWFILAISGGVISVVGTYAMLYAFHFTTEQISLQSLVRLPGAIICVALSTYLTRLMDKKYTVILTIVLSCLLVGLPYSLRLLGWFPPNGTLELLVAFYLIWTLGYIALPVVPIVIDSQLVDVADQHELRTGNRAEGLIFSIRLFAIKATQGLGGLIAGIGLALMHFPKHANAVNITPRITSGLLFMMGPLYYIIVFSGLGFACMYNITRKSHEDMLVVLEARRKAASTFSEAETPARAGPSMNSDVALNDQPFPARP
jgi:glycoside/pentoside/hexuronide:cation symporter, GPH family